MLALRFQIHNLLHISSPSNLCITFSKHACSPNRHRRPVLFSGSLVPNFVNTFFLIFQVAIPVVPTIRVLVTFTKFEELQPMDDFSTPPSTPLPSGRESPMVVQSTNSSSSWFQWMKHPHHRTTSSVDSCSNSSSRIDNNQDPFAIPRDYTWVTAEVKKKRTQEKGKAKKKSQNQ